MGRSLVRKMCVFTNSFPNLSCYDNIMTVLLLSILNLIKLIILNIIFIPMTINDLGGQYVSQVSVYIVAGENMCRGDNICRNKLFFIKFDFY